MIDETILSVYVAALARNYGWLRSGSDSYAFVPQFIELRDRIVPAWQRGEDVSITERHVSTLMTVIDLFESVVLDRYRGTRGMQRSACTEAEPGLLKAITDARKYVSKLLVRAH